MDEQFYSRARANAHCGRTASSFKDFFFVVFTCRYVFVWVCAHKYRCLQQPEVLDSPGARDTRGCDPLSSVGAGNGSDL